MSERAPAQRPATNVLLNALPQTAREALAPHLMRIEFGQHQILFDIGAPIRHVDFAKRHACYRKQAGTLALAGIRPARRR
ncbi:MAG: hypothetical protein WAM75_04610 [Xanthobacteraceae bacterium]